MTKQTINERRSIRRHLLGGTVIAIMLVGGVGGWAATTELSGAVIAPASVVVDTNVKKIQHPTGGVVGELFVRDGQRVSAGNIVLRLDDTVTRANLAIVLKGLDEMTARRARLLAERDRAEEIGFPAEFFARAKDPDVAAIMDGERKLFESRRGVRLGQKSQLKERVAQLGEEIQGHLALQKAKAEEIDLIRRELEGVRELWSKNLVQINRLIALEREAARLTGERAQSIFAMAQSRGKISEIELQILQIDQDLGSEVAKELRELDGRFGEFIERKVAAEDQLKRVDIRAPQDGVVHQLAVHTFGEVVTSGNPVMLIVPDADALSVEARVSPQDIDQLHLGQPAGLRFSGLNQRTTPEINGVVGRISADVSQDQRSGQSYYTVRINIEAQEAARLGSVKLIPGMPVESFMKTHDRTVLSYFVKPLNDQVSRAFRAR
ncbi:MAG: HlyD family type I secretion periplasmic adaptor subunit [Xanthobacteraceae bacterium]